MGNPVPVQTRAVDPYSSYQSNNINKITRIVSAGEDVILNVATDDLDVSIGGDNKSLVVNAGHCIKDDIYIATNAITVAGDDIDFYYSNPGGIFPEAGYYYVVMHYEYVKAKPAPNARIMILTPTQRTTIWQATPELFLFLKAFSVSGTGAGAIITNVYDTDPQNSNATRNLAGGTGGTVINALEDIIDVPSYAANAGKHLAVNGTETGTEWVDPPTSNIVVNKHEEIASVSQDTIDLTPSGWTYSVGSGNIVVYINGVRQASSAYTETDPSTITLSEQLSGGQHILVTSLEDSTGATFTGIYDSYIDPSLSAPVDYIDLPFSFISGHVDVYIDGVRQTPTVGFTENGTSRIDFSETLVAGTEIYVVALTSINSGNWGTLVVEHQKIIGTGTSSYTLNNPVLEGQFGVYINGVRQAPDAYTLINATTIDFVENIPVGDSVDIFYANDSITTNTINTHFVIAADIDGNTGNDVVIETPWLFQGGQTVVYVNGVRQNSQTSYTEISNNEIQITGLTILEGDEILLQSWDNQLGIQTYWELDEQNDLMPL